MARSRRFIESGGVYEVCFRANYGLPLPCLHIIKLLVRSAIARAQRDSKVRLCQFLCMANHIHILLVARDAQMCANFYGEVQKKLTDYLKRLLGVKKLNIWSGRATVMRILDKETVEKKIAYYYSNPANANLVDSIKQYPGLSTWEWFRNCSNELKAKYSMQCHWIRLNTIPVLPRRFLTPNQDQHYTNMLKENNKEMHELIIEPNAWMEAFGITSDEDVKASNQQINRLLEKNEQLAREQRAEKGWKVMGPSRLMKEAILAPHTPKKGTRMPYVISINNKLRVEYIMSFKEFCRKCRECYFAWKAGQVNVPWPPGAFIPPLPQLANSLA